jgi:hypothetical protein
MTEPTSEPSESTSGLAQGPGTGEVVARPSDGGQPRTRHGATGDYREQLRSRRWDAAPLRNPEVEKTDPRYAVAALVIMSAVTLLVLVLGYASGFWQLPASEGSSAAVAALELLA